MRYASNWNPFLWTVTVIGAALLSATASAQTLAPLPVSYNPTTKVATIGVVIQGNNPRVGGASVVFTEANSTLGTLIRPSYCDNRTNACEARLALAPGYALGPHTITAHYSGNSPPFDTVNVATSLTFTLYVSDPSFFPAVLHLLSD